MSISEGVVFKLKSAGGGLFCALHSAGGGAYWVVTPVSSKDPQSGDWGADGGTFTISSSDLLSKFKKTRFVIPPDVLGYMRNFCNSRKESRNLPGEEKAYKGLFFQRVTLKRKVKRPRPSSCLVI
jgi:hypothetical protein